VQKIRVLPAELANQIAAGEVVERPASVVKELVENALDAGATRCAIEIEGGGVTLIGVADDGSGMSEEDLRLSVERHATSKLSTLADLGRVSSFGFRGEALPSIASVSRFSITTRPKDSDAGFELVIEGGNAPSIRTIGAPVGSKVSVRDLFYNVPARRKFLRSIGTESGRVTDVVEAAALSRFDVTFTLHRDKRPVREWLRANQRAERVAQVTAGGNDLARCLGERGPLRMEAYLSRPEHARAGAGALRILVNDRPVRDRALALTVAQAYGSVLERGRYPSGVVYLNLPPELVDVNVHPQKAEVRFADPRAVTDALYSMLSRELSSAFSLPISRGSPFARREAPAPVAESPPPPSTQGDPWGLAPTARTGQESEPPETTPSETERRWPARGTDQPLVAVQDSERAPIRPNPELRWSSLRFIAQVRQTYLVCEAEDGLYVLDQHAAAERVTFDRLRKAYRSSAVGSQALLFPVLVDVTPGEAELIEARAEEIAAIGLDIRVRGPETISVHGVPRLLQKASPERIVRDLLSEVTKTGGRGFSDAVDLALATMACHGSIRAGDVLNSTEATALLRALDEADFAGHCPHGRPVVTFTSWNELDRRVGRR
jgi:DNA mismatch repair protein MutL